MNILVTGGSGFVGRYLLRELLASNQHQLFATSYQQLPSDLPDDLAKSVTWLNGDLQDPAFVGQLIDQVQPDQIYHLAGFSSAGESFKDPAKAIINNVQVSLNVLESTRQRQLSTKVLVVSSIDVYGLVDVHTDVVEETPFQPLSPYGVSKVAIDYLAVQYGLTHHLPIVRIRPSNHIGPGQGPGFVVASFCRQIARIEHGLQPPVIKVGNLEAIRDFTDVRDMVQAYVLALNSGELGSAYVAGSGQGIAVGDLLDQLIRLSTAQITVEQDQALMRPLDVPRIVVDATKLRNATGWQPKIDLDTTFTDLLQYWREADKDMLK